MSVKNTSETSLKTPFLDRNSIINLSLLAVSIFGGIYYSAWFFLLWPLFIVGDDMLMITKLRSIFDTEVAIKRGYQFAHAFLEKTSGHGRDLGFNLYDGDLTKDNAQAQIDKWEFVYNSLELKPGDRVIDIGCGYGDWLNYLKGRGHDVVGVNITPEQAHYAQTQYGLDVICSNWKDILVREDLQEKLYGRFDAVTYMDTIEHYVAATQKHTPEAERIYRGVFELADKLIRPDSQTGNVFLSCLHFHGGKSIRKQGFKLWLSTLLLIRYHSGSYPSGKEGLTQYAEEYFDETGRWDRTEDYRLTGVIDKDHFQAPKIRWDLKKLARLVMLFFLDPHHIHKWIDIKYDAWFNLYGEDAYAQRYDVEERYQKSLVILWWVLLKNKKIAKTSA